MPDVTRQTANATDSEGFEVVTSSAGDVYHTVLRVQEDAEEPTVEVTDRWKIDGETGEREAVKLAATVAVEDEMEERGYEVA